MELIKEDLLSLKVEILKSRMVVILKSHLDLVDPSIKEVTYLLLLAVVKMK